MTNNYKLFYGIVENIYDPSKLGHVQVRIHNIHSPYSDELDTSELPWCKVLSPASHSSNISGIGSYGVSLLQGSMVAGFFVDGTDAGEFIVLWAIDGTPEKHKGNSKGNTMFRDPSGKFPLEYGEPDMNKLVREITEDTLIELRDSHENLIDFVYTCYKGECYDELQDISSCDYRDFIKGKCKPNFVCDPKESHFWWEPKSRYNTKYPWGKVNQTISGHLTEYDDTPGFERINIQHRTLSYLTFHADGSIAIKDYKRRYDISKERRILTDGNVFNTINDSRYDLIKKKWHICSPEVKIAGDLFIEGKVEADEGHFNVIEAKYAKTLAEVAVCAQSICPFGTTSASGVNVTVSGKVLIDTISEAYELADLGISNALEAQRTADQAKSSTIINTANIATIKTTSDNNTILAQQALEESNKSTEFRGNLHLTLDEPTNSDILDLWASPTGLQQNTVNGWKNEEFGYNIDVKNRTILPTKTKLIIQSGKTPQPLSDTGSNMWLDSHSNKINEFVGGQWQEISNSIIGVSTISQTVKTIGGRPTQSVVDDILNTKVENLNLLDALSVTKGVLDGNIKIFTTLPIDIPNIGDLLVIGNVVKEVIDLGGGSKEWIISPNTEKLFPLLQTHIELNDYKHKTVKWFFQDVEPTTAKESDLWYNNTTYEIKRLSSGIWTSNNTSASDVVGQLSNVSLVSNEDSNRKLTLDDRNFSLESSLVEDNDLVSVLKFNYNMLDETILSIANIGNELIEKNSLVLDSHPDYKSLIVKGKSEFVDVVSVNELKLNNTTLADLPLASLQNKDIIRLVDYSLKVSNGTEWIDL